MLGREEKEGTGNWFKRKMLSCLKLKGKRALMTIRKNCPECEGKGTIRKIIYGLPFKEPDASKYMLGGCVMMLGWDFDIGCCECSWRSFSTVAKRKEFEGLTAWLAEKGDGKTTKHL